MTATLMQLRRDWPGVAMFHQAHCLLMFSCDSGLTRAVLQPLCTTSSGGVINVALIFAGFQDTGLPHCCLMPSRQFNVYNLVISNL